MWKTPMRFIILATGIALFIIGAYFYNPDNPWLCIPGSILIIASFPLHPSIVTSIIGLTLLADGFYFFEPNNLWLSGFGGFLMIICIVFYSSKTLRDACTIRWNSTLQAKKADEFSINVAEVTDDNKSLIDGYALYKQGKFDDAKLYFQNQIDNYQNSSEAKIAQAQLHFMSSKPPSFNVTTIFAMFIYFVFKDNGSTSFERAVESANFLGNITIAVITLYWIYYSFRWPNVSEANKNLSSAIGWLWFVSITTTLFGVLELSNVINVGSVYVPNAPRQETSVSVIMFLSGIVLAVMAYVATKARPLIGMIALSFAAIIYAYDTGIMLSLIALSKHVKLNEIIYTSAIIHVIALYSITKAIGACRALDLLVKKT